MNVREFLTKIGFEVDEKPLEKAEKHLEGLHRMLEGLAAAEVTKALFELAERFAHLGEEINVAAISAGLTVEEFQKLSFAANQSNVSQEEMQHGLALLSRRLYEARTGSKEAADAFRKAGITGDQIRGFKTSSDALFALSDRFTKIKDPIQKMGAAQELLGRGGYQMVAFLSKGSGAIKGLGDEAEKLGLILSGPQVEALEDVEHSFQKFYAVLRAIGAQIAAYIAPVFSALVDWFIKLYGANKELVGTETETWLNGVAYGIGIMTGLVQVAVAVLKKLEDALGLHGQGLSIVMWVGGAVGAFVALAHAINILGIVLAPIELLLSPIVIALGLMVVAIHDLYAAMTGGKGWTEGLLEMLGVAKQVDAIFGWIFDKWDGIVNLGSKIGGFLGFGGGGSGQTAAAPVNWADNINNPNSVAHQFSTTNVGGSSASASNVNQISVTVQGNASKADADHIANTIQEKLDFLARNTQRSTLSPVAY